RFVTAEQAETAVLVARLEHDFSLGNAQADERLALPLPQGHPELASSLVFEFHLCVGIPPMCGTGERYQCPLLSRFVGKPEHAVLDRDFAAVHDPVRRGLRALETIDERFAARRLDLELREQIGFAPISPHS